MTDEPNNLTTLVTLLHGLGVTLELAAVVLLIGAVGGLLLGLLATFGGRPVRAITASMLFLARGLPLLIQVFAIFYLLPLFGPTLDRFATAAVAVGLFASVTNGEVVRGSLLAIPAGQVEAGYALALTRIQTIVLIVLPQALRVIIAPLVGQFIFLIKATSIISLLGVPELMFAAREIIERDLEGFKVMAMVWLLYTAVCLPLSIVGRLIESRLAAPQRQAPKIGAAR